MMHDDDILDSREASKLLRLHEETLRRLTREGKIPAFRVGRRWRYNRRTLDAWARGQQQAPARDQKTVLVVDAEEGVRVDVRRIMEAAGFRVAAASGGHEALGMMRQELPDVVLLDLNMPDMDGPATLRAIRTAYEGIPVVIITAYPDSGLMAKALDYAPLLVLAKPVESQRLLSSIRTALSGAVEERGRPAAVAKPPLENGCTKHGGGQ